MTTATLKQQQHLINVLADKPKQFNYDIPVYRTQLLTLAHKLTADELRDWAYERGFCKDLDAIPTAKEWEEWNQQYHDDLMNNHTWQHLEDWDTDWERNTDYSNWELDGEIDTWTTLEGDKPTI